VLKNYRRYRYRKSIGDTTDTDTFISILTTLPASTSHLSSLPRCQTVPVRSLTMIARRHFEQHDAPRCMPVCLYIASLVRRNLVSNLRHCAYPLAPPLTAIGSRYDPLGAISPSAVHDGRACRLLRAETARLIDQMSCIC
jgi:hypothetical protein